MSISTSHFLPDLSEAQKLDWLQLYRSENIGPAVLRDLINFYGNAAAAIEALPEIAAKTKGGKLPKLAARARIEAEYLALTQAGCKLVARGERHYPKALSVVGSAPPIISVAGDAEILARPCVSIIGSRNASANGKRYAGMIAERLSQMGICVVSGFARGIDTAAHKGALTVKNGGGTAAVFSGGLDVVYPPENKNFFDELIASNGAVVSEMAWGWQPRAQDFPRRNRIVAGMAIATIVVEANTRSGSLITARLANELGRLIFAVPGSPMDPRSAGTNKLIAEGAQVVTDIDNLITQLTPMLENTSFAGYGTLLEDGENYKTDLQDEQTPLRTQIADKVESKKLFVLDQLSASPTEISELIRSSGLEVGVLNHILLELELDGEISKSAGYVTRLM